MSSEAEYSNSSPIFNFGRGKVTTEIQNGGDASSIALQADGKFILAGTSWADRSGFAVVRYNNDGVLDSSFGDDGKVITEIGLSATISEIVVQPDGKIVAVGRSTSKTDLISSITLIRYNSDGGLDLNFGNNGIVKFQTSNGSIANSVSLQLDGKIIVAGSIFDSPRQSFTLVRYNSDGSLDSSFGWNGKVETYLGFGSVASHAIINDTIIQPDGKILVAGCFSDGTYDQPALVRYDQNGLIDSTFGINGIVRSYFRQAINRISIQPDGKILALGTDILVRYHPDGRIDQSFDNDGKLSAAGATSILIQPDQKIIVAGRSENQSLDFKLVRYQSNGEIDKTFYDNGVSVTNFPDSSDWATAASLLNDGMILVSGWSRLYENQAPTIACFSVARFNSNGSLDGSFGSNSTAVPPFDFSESGGPINIKVATGVFDSELSEGGSYAGAHLDLFRKNGPNPEDRFESASSSISGFIEGSLLFVSGINVGVVKKNSAGILTIDFNESSTQALVDKVLTSISYANISDAPPSIVDIQWTFSDGNTGTQGTGGALAATGLTTVKIVPVEDDAVGSLTITGTAVSGSSLAVAFAAVDPDGAIVDISYQWQELVGSNWVELLRNDATNASIAIPTDGSFVGKKLRVLSTTTDSMGGETLFVSDAVQIGLPTSPVDISARAWKTKSPMAGVDVAIGGQQLATDSFGITKFSSAADSAASVSASVALSSPYYSGTLASVTLQDAVSILKIVAGQSANADGTPVLRFQSLAADFDGSGTVSLADALGVLRHAVGLQAPKPSWVFVEECDDALPSILSPGIPGPVTIEVTPPGPIEVNLIGILRGDVDGSYGVYTG